MQVLMSTSSGKSPCYQLLTMCTDGITCVPLLCALAVRQCCSFWVIKCNIDRTRARQKVGDRSAIAETGSKDSR
jgi:hypothetical protein